MTDVDRLVAEHVDRFNSGVTSRDFAEFAADLRALDGSADAEAIDVTIVQVGTLAASQPPAFRHFDL